MNKDSYSTIISEYTREAGVRNLEREIASIMRKTAHIVVRDKTHPKIIMTPDKVRDFLGTQRFKNTPLLKEDEVGASVGLAWTQNGGEVLIVEARLMPGKGQLELTGQMGDVMRESAKAALSYLRSNSKKVGLSESNLKIQDIHIHIPEGAIQRMGHRRELRWLLLLLQPLQKSKFVI